MNTAPSARPRLLTPADCGKAGQVIHPDSDVAPEIDYDFVVPCPLCNELHRGFCPEPVPLYPLSRPEARPRVDASTCPCCNGTGRHELRHLEGPHGHEWAADCAACSEGDYRGHDCTDKELSRTEKED